MKHYSEADLLETYYTQPGESMPVMMHLADCDECAARYERLEKKLRGLAACGTERPDSFWARQRISVMRKIDVRRTGASPSPVRTGRFAVAAMLVLVAGSLLTWQQREATTPAAIPRAVTASVTIATDSVSAATQETAAATDPWQSDELKDFQSMVAWESWEPTGTRTGDQSL